MGYYALNDPGWSLADSALWPGLKRFATELGLMADLSRLTPADHRNEDGVEWAGAERGVDGDVAEAALFHGADNAGDVVFGDVSVFEVAEPDEDVCPIEVLETLVRVLEIGDAGLDAWVFA